MAHIEQETLSVLECTTDEALKRKKEKTDKHIQAGQSVLTSLTKHNKALKDHKSKEAKARHDQASKAAAEQAAKEAADQQKQAQERAAKLLSAAANKSLPWIHQQNYAEDTRFSSIGRMKLGEQELSVDEPYLVETCGDIENWAADKEVVKVLEDFSKTYKRETQYLDNNRTVKRLSPGNPALLLATKTLMDKLCPPDKLDFSSVSRSVHTGFFLTGMAPKSTLTGVTPNACGMLRVQHMGEVCSTVVPLHALKEAAGEALNEKDGLAKYVDNLDSAKLSALYEQGVKIYYAMQGPLTALYVPPGWLLIDKCTTGQLITSVRLAVLHASTQARSNMSAAVDFFTDKEKAKITELIDVVKKAIEPAAEG